MAEPFLSEIRLMSFAFAPKGWALCNGHTLGELGGEQAHTLSIAELPTHTHVVAANSSATPGTHHASSPLISRGSRTKGSIQTGATGSIFRAA